MKSNAGVLRVYAGMLSDISANIEGLEVDVSRDYVRLSMLLNARGINLVLIDFPDVLKWLDESLKNGALSVSGLPTTSGIARRSPVPKLFRGLYLRVFAKSGVMLEDPDPTSIFYLRQLLALFKKYKKDCKDEFTSREVESFYETDLELPRPRLDFDQAESFPFEVTSSLKVCEMDNRDGSGTRSTSSADHVVQLIFDRAVSQLDLPDSNSAIHRHGPGAVSIKIPEHSWKYHFHQWPESLNAYFPMEDHAISNYSEWSELQNLDTHNSVYSRLCKVPKTARGPRLIAAEPVSHQWCQQALRKSLESMVSSSFLSRCINFRDQGENQRLALEGSKTGQYATIDLSAASDRIGLKLVESVFRKNIPFLQRLAVSRSRYVYQNISSKHPMIHKLRKFSTMGSACTFPIQSIIFSCIAIAAILIREGKNVYSVTNAAVNRAADRVQVFGDDIVVPNNCYDAVTGLLERYGMKVNLSKSCSTGKFRESCGMDAFNGYDVTPAYFTQFCDERKPESIVAMIEVSNNFFKKGLWKTSNILATMVPKHFRVQVPIDSGAVGLGSYTPNVKLRYNHHLQRDEMQTVKLTSKQSVTKINDPSALLQWFTEAPKPDTQWESGRRERVSLKIRLGWDPLEIAAA